MTLPTAGETAHRVGARAVEVTIRRGSGRHDRHSGDSGFRRARTSAPVGRIIEILGRPDDFGIDVEILIRTHHIPHRFPDEVLEQARSRSRRDFRSRDRGRRRDFRALDIVTIDGETARDFDDAVWVERLPNGNYALQVHIADVSHYVRPGSPIDREARCAAPASTFPDRAVPMLPVELSTGPVLASPARGPAGAFGRCSRSTARATWSRRSSAAA